MNERQTIDLSDEDKRRVVTLDKGTLRRTLGVRHLFAVGYSDVGSSIYYALGVTTLWAAGATPFAFLVAGVFFACTVFTYAELSAAKPEAGGAASFARLAFGDVVSFIAGWGLMLSYIMTIAISAYTAMAYLGYFWPAMKVEEFRIVATVVFIGVLFLLNFIGIRESAGVSWGITVLDLLIEGLLLILGLIFAVNLPRFWSQIHWGVSPTWTNFIRGVSVAMVNYTGVEAISQLAEEVRSPTRTVPRAHMLEMAAVLVFSLGISLIAMSVMSPQTMVRDWINDPMAGVAAHMPSFALFGHEIVSRTVLAPAIAILGIALLAVAANAGVVGGSRLFYSFGNHFQLSNTVARLHSRFRTPYIALALCTGLAAAIVVGVRRIERLADVYVFGAMLAFAFAHVSMLALRIKLPDLERPFRAPFNVTIAGRSISIPAIIGLLATGGVWLNLTIAEPHVRALGLGWLAIGLAVYFRFRQEAGVPVGENLEIERIRIPEFEKLRVKHILVPTAGSPILETLQAACKIAREDDAKITALYVMEIPPTMPVDTFLPVEFEKGNQALDRARAIAHEFDVPIDGKLVQAHSAAEAVVETARDLGCDLIVLGASGRKNLANVLFGRVADYVVRNAPCRVWISSAPESLPR